MGQTLVQIFAYLSLIGAAGATAWAIRRSIRRLPAGEMRCGRCYAKTGRPVEFACAECGHDLRESGMEQPVRSSYLPMARWLVGVNIYLLLVAMLGASYLRAYEGMYLVEVTRNWHGKSEAYAGIQTRIVAYTGFSGGQDYEGHMRWTIVAHDGRLAVLEIMLPAAGYRMTDAAGATLAQGELLDQAGVVRWMEQADVVVSDDVKEEAKELVTLMSVTSHLHGFDDIAQPGGPGESSRLRGSGGRRTLSGGQFRKPLWANVVWAGSLGWIGWVLFLELVAIHFGQEQRTRHRTAEEVAR